MSQYDPSKPTVKIKRFTPGFGNNVFQYVFGRLLAETHGFNFSHDALPTMGIKANKCPLTKKFKTITLKSGEHNDTVFHQYFTSNQLVNYELAAGFFLDYTFYKPHLKKIRNWFPTLPKTNTTDVIVHLRLQGRLLQTRRFNYLITPEGYKNILQKINFENVHIVTDCNKWDYYNEKDIENIRKGMTEKVIIRKNKKQVPIKNSIQYINDLIDTFKEFNPIIHCETTPMKQGTLAHRTGFMDHFNLIRSFDKIIHHASTFSWWAAVLSEASEVGVFEMWGPLGKRQRNLGQTDYPGWFTWGNESELVINSVKYKE